MDFKYFQFASPFNSSRKITTAADVDSYWDESRDMDTGRSWQLFDSSLLHYMKYNNDSPSGYQGKSDSPLIPIDIDNSSTTNLKGVLNHFGEIIGDLESINLYYSGKKGYHIELPSGYFGVEPCDRLPERIKRMVMEMNIGADLSLYKNHQLWRMNNSLNVSGGCYKTKLDITDILDGMELEDIKLLAGKPHLESFEMIGTGTKVPIPVLQNFWESTHDITKMKISGGVPEGYRNANAYDTAMGLKTQQYDRETAYKVVEEQNKLNNPPEPNLEGLFKSVDSAYDGEYFKKFPFNPVFQHLKEDVYWNELNNRRKVVYIHMLMDANVREHIFEDVRIKANQFVFGKIKTAKRWGMKVETLRKDMEKFEKDGIITRKVISKGGKNLFSIITIQSFDVTHQLYTHF
ncbi:hypothetical protein EB821_05885 [Candidatus Marinimicrobia bacterium PRS2]|nr:hypothetical protein EB821_05885 [Candidatus Marinimicrobia bacterium PRS2]